MYLCGHIFTGMRVYMPVCMHTSLQVHEGQRVLDPSEIELQALWDTTEIVMHRFEPQAS